MGDDNTSALGDRPTNGPPSVSSLEDLKGKLLSEAMDPYGCEFLHQKLRERKLEDIHIIFSEVKDHICVLMLSPLGSDFLQKLYEVLDKEQMAQLVSSATADVRLLVDVCLDSQGSESMQEFIGLMTPKQIFHMIWFFTYFMVPLVNHQFGSRVIGRCFNIFPAPADETEPIVNVIADNCLEIAKDKYGSCLLQVII
ncbi:pumilio homolog 12-like [Primulina tabacum]|uniref:pumilio homolog 12-like n=1 Tax=Primulina tabacum TaxID=48773 RepID=UPI003F5A4AED